MAIKHKIRHHRTRLRKLVKLAKKMKRRRYR